ncbi:short-chain dehydrogenase [Mycolicibacterium moriokaense]|jgi:NAD(P)-dependent dehydrogenase (short-subunit alcohol dehydrogenase family)|uniref:Short-chain dehydrogenase n=1 Tax=Mycolicibacterium moriokaense TaxID=39691 RepID=A0AAD1HHA6_9MYCO|nr:SDR family NAD(P)-dependent oxidoreductase [Mycolicibacterium moriokaense]MCV7042134.1 SDR family NAD(P)-dependent oxidoreductase [Mycolicibacterium moriokaense]ORB25199.1 short-chain dehydrogenase [Mycolicibacterium moriokaense]BBX04904.1 short-chain dehydrogenase [Mycolicibacterium moriokaense]
MAELRFDGRVAIVTGAGGGLGKSHALLLAARGAKVVVNDVGGSVTGEGSDTGPAELLVSEIRANGGEAAADANSVATPEGGAAIVATAMDNFGRVDIVVNNAGILRDKMFEDMTMDLVDPVLDVHLKGAFNVTRPAFAIMQRQGYGRIVSTCSASGILGSPSKANYAAAKTGLIGLTRVLAAEGAAHNIKANALSPIAYTRMLAHSLEGPEADEQLGPDPDAAKEQLTKMFTETLDPGLVSPAVAFLAHEDCPVSGELYTAGGGQVSRWFIGRTAGYFNRGLTIEDVAEHFDEIRDETGYTVMTDPAEEVGQVLTAVTGTATTVK